MQWPEWVKIEIISSNNCTGTLKSSDLEMAGLLLLWLVMEEVCEVKSRYHVAVLGVNQTKVSWVDQLASKSSVVAGQLLRALALRFKNERSIATGAISHSWEEECYDGYPVMLVW